MAIASGTWNTCSWTISDAGVLTIGAGTGAEASVPWENYKTKITSVKTTATVRLPDDMTSLFEGCTALTSVDFSNAKYAPVMGYLDRMFYGCSALTTINFGSSFTAYAVYTAVSMFEGCSSLETLDLSTFTIGNYDYWIDDRMFYGCPAKITISSVSTYGLRGTSFTPALAELGTVGDVITYYPTDDTMPYKMPGGTFIRDGLDSALAVTAVRTTDGEQSAAGADLTLTVTTYKQTGSLYYTVKGSDGYTIKQIFTVSDTTATTYSTTISDIGESALEVMLCFKTDSGISIWQGKVNAASWQYRFYPNGDFEAKGAISGSALNVGGKSLLDLTYPVGSIYMSVNSTSPATLFGGTWEQIEDTFLLASGSTYTAGSTGGSATHTLTTSEMPSHTHSGTTGSNGSHTHSGTTGSSGSHTHSGTTGSGGGHTHTGTTNSAGKHTHSFNGAQNTLAKGSAYMRPFNKGSSSYYKTNESGSHTHTFTTGSSGSHTHTFTTGSSGSHTHTFTTGSTGGGSAFSTMPPYLAVYVWKRTA